MSTNTKGINIGTTDPWWVRIIVISISIAFVTLMLILPLSVIFWEALRKGISTYVAAFQDRNAMRAIYMTCLAAGIAVPLNLVFGIIMYIFLE